MVLVWKPPSCTSGIAKIGMENKRAIKRENPDLVLPRSQEVAKGLLYYPFSTRLTRPYHQDDHTESCTRFTSTY